MPNRCAKTESTIAPKSNASSDSNTCIGVLAFRLPGHLDHRRTKAEACEKALCKHVALRRRKNHARRSAHEEGGDRGLEQRPSNALVAAFRVHHEVVHDARGTTQGHVVVSLQ